MVVRLHRCRTALHRFCFWPVSVPVFFAFLFYYFNSMTEERKLISLRSTDLLSTFKAAMEGIIKLRQFIYVTSVPCAEIKNTVTRTHGDFRLEQARTWVHNCSVIPVHQSGVMNVRLKCVILIFIRIILVHRIVRVYLMKCLMGVELRIKIVIFFYGQII